ncbi:MAG TPA: helix-turn-helix transcriptional regulator [Bacteroidales bacterium]|nr:helix-turn-helix transcriptional regulator [Bacteroidales bacterium]
MTIKQLRKELGLSAKDVAELFSMSYSSFANSTARKRYETALCRLYEKAKEKCTTTDKASIENKSDPSCLGCYKAF